MTDILRQEAERKAIEQELREKYSFLFWCGQKEARDILFQALVDSEKKSRSQRNAGMRESQEKIARLQVLLKECGERIWQHHELGFIRKAAERIDGSCELCRDGIFQRIESELEKEGSQS